MEPVIAPALVTLSASLIYTGDLHEGESWLQRADRALETDSGPGIKLLTHLAGGMLQAGRGHLVAALGEFGEAERLRSQLTGSHALASQVTGWLLATQARLGMTAVARTALAALDDERASSGEVVTARAMICLADGDAAGLSARCGRSWTVLPRSSGTS